MCVTNILLLAPLIFCNPTESKLLYNPYQALRLSAESPEGVETQKDLTGILSVGPIIIGSINNGIPANQVLEYNSMVSSIGRPLGTNPKPENNFKEGLPQSRRLMGLFREGGKYTKDILSLNGFRLFPGNFAGLGLSSTQIFQNHAKGVAVAKAKEKEMPGHFEFVTDMKETEGKDEPKGEQASWVKLLIRPKAISRPEDDSEAVSFVISEPSESSETSLDPSGGKPPVMQSDGEKLEKEIRDNEVLPQNSSPVQKYIIYSQLIQPIILPCFGGNSNPVPQQPTSTIQATTEHPVLIYAKSTTSGASHKTQAAATTKQVRSLMSQSQPKQKTTPILAVTRL